MTRRPWGLPRLILLVVLLPLAAGARPAATVNTWEVKSPAAVLRDGQGGEIKWLELKGLKHHLVLPSGDLVVAADELDRGLLEGTSSAFLAQAAPGTGMMARVSGVNGSLAWAFPLWGGRQKSAGNYSNPVLFRDHVWIAHGLYLEKHDPADGTCLQRYQLGTTVSQLEAGADIIRFRPYRTWSPGNRPDGIEVRFDGSRFDIPMFLNFRDNSVAISHLGRSRAGFWQGDLDAFLGARQMRPMYKNAKTTVDWAKAEAFFLGMQRLDPGNPYVACTLGQICFWTGRIQEADAQFETAVRDDETLGFWEYGRLGWLFESYYRLPPADRCYELMQKKYFAQVPFRVPYSGLFERQILLPSSATGANLHFAQGNIFRAEQLYELHKRLFPFCDGDATFSYLYAAWLEENGEYSEAAAERIYYRKASRPSACLGEATALRFDLLFNGAMVACLLAGIFTVAALVATVLGLFKRGRWGWLFLGGGLVGMYLMIDVVTRGGMVTIGWLPTAYWVGLYVFLLASPVLSRNFRWLLACSLLAAIFLFTASSVATYRIGERIGASDQYFRFPGELTSAQRMEDYSRGNPGAPYGRFLLGLSRHMQGKTDEAMALYRDAGDEPDALNNLGILQETAGDVVEAKDSYKQSAALGNAAAYYNLGRLTGDPAQFEQARSREPMLVVIQRKFMPDRPMFSPVDSDKVQRFIASKHRPLMLLMQNIL